MNSWRDSIFILATIQNISAEKYQNFELAVPSLAEQCSIIDILDDRTLKIDTLIAKAEEGIHKLEEYRTALISAAVTGKIDVRGEVQA